MPYFLAGSTKYSAAKATILINRRNEIMMKDSNTTGECNTPNTSVRCTVCNCANHCQNQDYCGLNTVQIGTHEDNPTEKQCVDCDSFKLK